MNYVKLDKKSVDRLTVGKNQLMIVEYNVDHTATCITAEEIKSAKGHVVQAWGFVDRDGCLILTHVDNKGNSVLPMFLN